MEFIIYALLGIIILMLCFVIFLLWKLYENSADIQELTAFMEWIGEDYAEEKE